MLQIAAIEKKWNILLTEDDEDDQFFFEKALLDLKMRMQLTILDNGEKLLNYLVANTTCLPDVLFLDINLPRKDGIQCLLAIKQNAALQHIPVVMCSTFFNKALGEKLFLMGAYCFVQKCNYSEFTGAINAVFALLKAGHRPGREDFVMQQSGLQKNSLEHRI